MNKVIREERVTNVCNCHSEDEVRRIYFVTFLQILSHFVAQNDGYFVKFSIFLSLRRTSEQSVKRMTSSIYCHCEDERSEDVAIHCLLICWKLYTFVVILSHRRSICFPGHFTDSTVFAKPQNDGYFVKFRNVGATLVDQARNIKQNTLNINHYATKPHLFIRQSKKVFIVFYLVRRKFLLIL